MGKSRKGPKDYNETGGRSGCAKTKPWRSLRMPIKEGNVGRVRALNLIHILIHDNLFFYISAIVKKWRAEIKAASSLSRSCLSRILQLRKAEIEITSYFAL